MALSCSKKIAFITQRANTLVSKYVGDIYYLSCFFSYSTEKKLKKQYEVCKNHNYYFAEMPKGNNRTMKFNHGEKSITP